MPPIPKICGNCSAFQPEFETGPHDLSKPSQGVCRRLPPQAQLLVMQGQLPNGMATQQQQVIAFQPPVKAADWCRDGFEYRVDNGRE